jgi:hypothetical protein
MTLNDILQQTGGIDAMARELGLSPSQAASGAEALLPAILGGFKRHAQAHPAGLDGLGGLLQQMGGGGLLDQVLAAQPTDVRQGNDVLGQIFGSPEVSRTVAQHAATQSGIDASMLRKMLPLLAMLVGGFIARQHGAAQAAPGTATDGSGLDGLPGGLFGGGAAAGGASLGAGGSPLAGLASMLDLNGDGNPLDDILRIAGRALG